MKIVCDNKRHEVMIIGVIISCLNDYDESILLKLTIMAIYAYTLY